MTLGAEDKDGVEDDAVPMTEVPTRRARRRSSLWAELPVLLVVALGLAILIKTFAVQAFYIPSGSMENTLRVGDRVLVDKLSYRLSAIKRGDIVVFNGLDSFTPEVVVEEPTNVLARALLDLGQAIGVAPPGERDFIKRVIGVPGDRVRCCDADGRITVNGVALTEPYVFPGDQPSEQPFDAVVPTGKLWVMGDHRSRSADSRVHLGDPGGGTVPSDKVIGRAFTVIWPPAHWIGLGRPVTFDRPRLAVTGAPAAGAPYSLGLLGALPLLALRRRSRRSRAGTSRRGR